MDDSRESGDARGVGSDMDDSRESGDAPGIGSDMDQMIDDRGREPSHFHPHPGNHSIIL
jgi:hypothetical protein